MTTKVTKSGVDNITLNANGNVGIGTSSPTYPLTVAGSSQSTIEIKNTSGTGEGRLYFSDDSTTAIGGIEYQHNGDFMRFYTNSTERMRIDSSGRVTMPYQPFFSAKHNNSESPGAGGTFVNWTVDVNNGGNSFSSGVYTVYTAGYYQIHVALLMSPGAWASGVYLTINGTNYQRLFYTDSATTNNTYQMGAGSAVKYLNVGDSVKFTAQGSAPTWYGDTAGLGNITISMLG